MTVVTRQCASCAKPIRLTDGHSLYQPDGTFYEIFCADCWQQRKKKGGEKQ